MSTVQLHNADCLEIMRTMPDKSVDLVLTDPPYGYSFMGKDWDKTVPSVEIWKETLRVLKDGAFAFIMSSPRQDVFMHNLINLEKAGFNIGFTSIYWAYASGFPKAGNIGKMVDKRQGAIRQGAWSENNFAKPVTYETGNPITDDAKRLEGSYAGFQPKPAVEIIIVAMKPLSEKTYVDQALKNGKGITWLDDGRIPAEKIVGWGGNGSLGYSGSLDNDCDGNPKEGRFPANLLVSDDVLNDGESISYGKSSKPYSYQGKEYSVDGFIKENSPNAPSNFGDSGSFSRYFDLDKWAERFPFLIVPKADKGEKNLGCEELEFGEAQQSARSKPAEGRQSALGKPRNNHHPTVKPLKLMAYLITIGSREDDTVLDMFQGSGTTGVACCHLNRNYIGVEREKEFHDIATARIEEAQNTLFTNIDQSNKPQETQENLL